MRSCGCASGDTPTSRESARASRASPRRMTFATRAMASSSFWSTSTSWSPSLWATTLSTRRFAFQSRLSRPLNAFALEKRPSTSTLVTVGRPPCPLKSLNCDYLESISISKQSFIYFNSFNLDTCCSLGSLTIGQVNLESNNFTYADFIPGCGLRGLHTISVGDGCFSKGTRCILKGLDMCLCLWIRFERD